MSDKGKKFLTEFKEFALKGNVLDLAIGVIIGGAFNKIVSSLVQDVIMPLIGIIVGGVKFEDLAYVLKSETATTEAVTLKYGAFIQNVVDFLIIALSIFVFIKIITKLNRKREEEAIEEAENKEPELTVEQELLIEIRDLLKEKS
ncbi:MAG: large-conductance mechanosensitive channel protein MscL [Clostridium sp.]|uniref:large-conductance mechanosensitive channel protein MscL n=1 Tax=Clostridium sp. TaxID=1506 RepID=UPI0025B7F64F|nr:large-conductance mechanosensitive channel protein MscL [Clostridium sp.]MCF0147782.1 large-conductance mechanosensitive channel protein MscL [Clostridium sp.]